MFLTRLWCMAAGRPAPARSDYVAPGDMRQSIRTFGQTLGSGLGRWAPVSPRGCPADPRLAWPVERSPRPAPASKRPLLQVGRFRLRWLGGAALLALAALAFVTPADAQTTCNAPTLESGRTVIWTGTVTVGTSQTSGIAFYGKIGNTGSIDDSDFIINSTTYELKNVHTQVGGTYSGRLSFVIGSAVPRAIDRVGLQLHVCDETFSFIANGPYRASTNWNFIWENAGLDWSNETTRVLRLSLASPTVSSVLVSNFEQAAFDLNRIARREGAMRFTTGSHPFGYTLSSIDIISNDDESDTFSARLCEADTNGFPPAHPDNIATHSGCPALTAPGSFAAGIITFTAPANTVLAANTTYTVVFRKAGGVHSVRYDGTKSTAEDTGSAAGWTIGDVYDVYRSGLSQWQANWVDNDWTEPLALQIAVRGAERADATLSALALSEGTLNPVFSPTHTSYTTEGAVSVSQITVTPTKNDANATVAYLDGDDMSLTDADTTTAGFQVDLTEGENVIKVKVTATDDTTTKTYTMTVNRIGAGTLRLVNGPMAYEGRLEIFLNSQWGTICDDNWSIEDADVACRTLGYANGSVNDADRFRQAFFGRGTGPIHLDDLECGGSERNLFDCPHAGIGVHNCTHDEDVGVRCLTGRAIRISPTEISVPEGGSTGYTVALTSAPTGSVTVAIEGASGDLSVEPPQLEFTISDWNQAKTVTISAADDGDSDEDPPVTLTHSASGGGYDGISGSLRVIIVEDDMPPSTAPTASNGTVPTLVRPPPQGGGGPTCTEADVHGNQSTQATAIALDAVTAGAICPAPDVDYFTVAVPQAGVLVVETTGRTDTVGTVWKDGEELATDDNSGASRNFRLSVRVEAGPVVLAVAGTGNRTGSYRLETTLFAGYLENPGADSFQSGIGVISGWTCEAEAVEIELNGMPLEAAYGTERLDTAEVCGDTDNGFGLLFNWNLLGDGEHEVVALVDGVELSRTMVTVTTLGEEFVRGVADECVMEDFPLLGETATLEWQQRQQNFVIARGTAPTGADRAGAIDVGYLENPGPNSFQSGIGVISGWVCEGDAVLIALNGVPQLAAYGTERADTEYTEEGEELCGDTDNGFGLLFNWNLLGEGVHTK